MIKKPISKDKFTYLELFLLIVFLSLIMVAISMQSDIEIY